MKRSAFIVAAVVLIASGCEQQTPQPTPPPQQPVSQQVQMPEATGQSGAMIKQGLLQLRSSDVTSAIKSFDEAIKLNPREPQGYVVLGQTYLRLGEYARAVDTFEAATRVAPDQGQIYYLLAISYGLQGKKDLAQQNAQKSIEMFQTQHDEENFLRALSLLQGLSKTEE